MKIRKAQPPDMPQVLALIQELATFEKEPDAVVVTTEDLLRDGFGENPLFQCFVAETADEIVGIALFYYRYSTWKGKTIHLEDLIVRESYRGKNIGFELYKKVMEQGYHEKVRRIEWAVLDWNTAAINFYKKHGANVLDDWRICQIDETAIKTFIDLQKNKIS